MEEMKFLFTHTPYARECLKLLPVRDYYSYDDEAGDKWVPESVLRKRRAEIRNRIREEYLVNSRSREMALPLKWTEKTMMISKCDTI